MRIGSDLAATPPMGWNSWNAFGTTVDATIVRETADALVETGLRDLGYRYVVVDDGWASKAGRDANRDLVPDPDRFPDGMAAVAEHVHRRGLRFGIYSDAAALTCAGHPGSLGHEERDAALWASWGVDFLKYDYCHAPDDLAVAIERYGAMRRALDATGREILLSICEWGGRQPHLWGREVGGQMWRSTGDVVDSWSSVPVGDALWPGIDGSVDRVADLGAFAGPGGWNDLDMLVVGLHGRGSIPGSGASHAEYRSQVSMWSLLASPLMIGCDVRSIDAETLSLLANPEIVAIDQDALGRPAERLWSRDRVELWRRQLADGGVALGLHNRSPAAVRVELSPADFGGEFASGRRGSDSRGVIRDAWRRADIGQVGLVADVGHVGRAADFAAVDVAAHDTAVLTARPED